MELQESTEVERKRRALAAVREYIAIGMAQAEAGDTVDGELFFERQLALVVEDEERRKAG